MTKDTNKAKDNKATRVPGTFDNATGKRKKKLDELVHTGPRRLVPKKMVDKIDVVGVEQEIGWIWGCAAEKPVEEDVTQEQRDSTSAVHIVKEHRALEEVAFPSPPTCSRHRKKKTIPSKQAPRKVKATPNVQDNVTSDTTSTNTDVYEQSKESSDQKALDGTVGGINGKDEGKDDHKELEQDKAKCEDKDKEQDPDNMVTLKQDEQREMEEDRKKRLGRRLRKDLKKGLRMQKNLHMKLHSQLKLQKDLDMTKAILTELEKGLKLQKMVVNGLRMRKDQDQDQEHEHDLHELSLLRVKICEDSSARHALTLTVDIQAPAA
ncbi:hypothetical protein BGZ96_003994 [Linnemannia gamsii]|uniref:Uncharacterized protein n=1 Tax=Linnemannia gamsii TaxID=64522 RepID=A0ABQ7K6A0_9FUNG|nr:hypothetical protein BGZ96_003994 [Linnemannia gamsii]